jgi:excisionase family DNA binding protein
MEDKKRRFSVQEAATVLGVNDRTVYRLIERGELDAVKPGRSYTITRSHLRDYLGGEDVLEDLEATASEDDA